MVASDVGAARAKAAWTWVDGAVVALLALLGALVFWAMHDALVDDAYITLVYARNLAEHGQWGLLAGRTTNTATSPLNVLTLALLSKLTGGPVRGLGVLAVLNAALLAVGLLLLGRSTGLGRRLAVISGALLLLNPLLASTTGLETMLAVTALVFLLWSTGGERAWPVGVAAGVTVLVRLDLVVVVLVVVLLHRRLWRRLPWVALWATVVALPWFVFSWFALGSAVPDTLLIKTARHWGDFATGLVSSYLRPYPLGVVGTLAPVAVGLLALLTWPLWRRWIPGPDRAVVPVAGAAALGYYLTFVRLGVSPFFWYYGVPVSMLVLVAGLGASALTRRSALVLRVGVAALVLAVSLLPAGLDWARGLERRAPLEIALVKGNWAMPWQYARIGRALGGAIGPHTPVKSPGEIGTLLYFCRCELVDRFSDRGRLVPDIVARRRSSIVWRINYHWLDTGQLTRIRTVGHLRWVHGRDPSGRGWNVSSRTGHGPRSGQGYIALLEPGGRPMG